MGRDLNPLILGRREWVALPDLGLTAVKSKIDTGARTSALHAENIQIFGPAGKVRFTVYPLLDEPEFAVACEADLFDLREVTCSSGERETRPVIVTKLSVGGRVWPIEVGLTNRDGLQHRMLLGRQAIQPGMLVDPTRSFLMPRLSARLYRTPA